MKFDILLGLNTFTVYLVYELSKSVLEEFMRHNPCPGRRADLTTDAGSSYSFADPSTGTSYHTPVCRLRIRGSKRISSQDETWE